jgi:uncharacterized Rmd1/YagE family protein
MEIAIITFLFFLGAVVFWNYTETQNIDVKQSQNLNEVRKTLYDIHKRVDLLTKKVDDLEESIVEENEDEQST